MAYHPLHAVVNQALGDLDCVFRIPLVVLRYEFKRDRRTADHQLLPIEFIDRQFGSRLRVFAEMSDGAGKRSRNA
ncbi:amino acid/amide ABC transporter substrate-binding, HAAT family domain protein [Burkholderia pseudomallei TSV44]|nr:amino acid/amide ABC transporter substrate-binding, HAAT family domain protein [Burkholderia pseudomallei TSV44]